MTQDTCLRRWGKEECCHDQPRVLTRPHQLTWDTIDKSAALAHRGEGQVGGEQQAQPGHAEDGDGNGGQVKGGRSVAVIGGCAVGIRWGAVGIGRGSV
jgi:hypothetical protein